MITRGAEAGGDWRGPVLDRTLIRFGVRDDVARIVGATSSLRTSWLVATIGVALLVAWGDQVEPHVLALVAVLAPVLPVVGVAAAYGPWIDPMFDVAQASPASGFRVLLLRSIAVLAAAGGLVAVATVTMPQTGVEALAWLLPSLALCATSLMLSTFVSLPRASTIVAFAWLALAAIVVASRPATSLFTWPAQVGFCGVAIGSALIAVRRRQHLEIANLRSRRAMVDAANVERRRIERNIHDGAQQQLVSIGVKAGLARMMVTRDPDKAIEILDQVCVDAEAALAGLRHMTRGALPPILADHGLAVAIADRAKSAGVPVIVSADGVGRLPEAVEVAAYYCCSEALQNTTKYAHASGVSVSLRVAAGALILRIVDDGAGFDVGSVPRGVGMRSMSERATAVGGTLDVRSSPAAGTTITATIPVTSPGS
jgi:signal transduction histidine kinase